MSQKLSVGDHVKVKNSVLTNLVTGEDGELTYEIVRGPYLGRITGLIGNYSYVVSIGEKKLTMDDYNLERASPLSVLAMAAE